METLEDFVALALSNVEHTVLKERVSRLFSRFDVREARKIIELSNKLTNDYHGIQEKGAVGEAVVAAAIRRYFGRYDGKGLFDFQYEYWGDRAPDAKYPARTMDIIFIKPTGRSSSIAFQIEAKNRRNVDKGTLSHQQISKQISKDHRYLNPRIKPDRPLIPVWWFLQGLERSARNELEAIGFRVVDFNRDPFDAEIEQAFAAPLSTNSRAQRTRGKRPGSSSSGFRSRAGPVR